MTGDVCAVYEATVTNPYRDATVSGAGFTRVYSTSHKFAYGNSIVIENGLYRIRLATVPGTPTDSFTIYHPRPEGFANAGTVNDTWDPVLGSATTVRTLVASGLDVRLMTGFLKNSPEEVVVRVTEFDTSNSDIIEYDLIVRRGSPVLEFRVIQSNNTPRFRFQTSDPTIALHRLSALMDFTTEGIANNATLQGTATDPWHTMILVRNECVLALCMPNASHTSGILYTTIGPDAYFTSGSLYLAVLTWNATGLGSTAKKPLQRQCEELTTELTTSGVWTTTTATAGYSGSGWFETTGNGNYAQYPLHGPRPGLYVVALRTYGNTAGAISDAWSITVDGVEVFNTTSNSNSNWNWKISRPVLLTSASVVRLVTTDVSKHLADSFVLFPLHRSGSTAIDTQFPLDVLYDRLTNITVSRDVLHLEEV